MNGERLTDMANQIAANLAAQARADGRDPADATADHLRQFWSAAMRRALLAHDDAGGAGMDPDVRRAVARLRQR